MKKNPILDDNLYSLQEIAGILRVSERSIFRYIHGGKLRATKIGYWKISGLDLRIFLTENANIRNTLMMKDFILNVPSKNKKQSNGKK